jgi:hypothetical protein
MSAYSGTPTVNQSYEIGDRNGKLQEVLRDLTLTIDTQGGTSNTIGYAALGFADGRINSVVVVNFTDTGPQNRGIIAWTDGDNVYLGDPQAATDAARCEPIDLSGTLRLRLTGWPA